MVLLKPLAAGIALLYLVSFAQSTALPEIDKGQPHKGQPHKGHPNKGGHHHHDHNPVHISKELYRQMQIYTNYTSAARLSKAHCPNPPYQSKIVNYFSIINNLTSTQGTIFRNDADKEFIVAFPGTHGPIDYRDDRKLRMVRFETIGVSKHRCKGCMVAEGFFREWRGIAKPISKAIKAHHKERPDYRITVAGHSLGATIAAQCTASFRGQGLKFRTFTFGEPRSGNREWADHIDRISGAIGNKPGSYYRVTHANDGVPHYPPRSHGYMHSKTEYWQRNTKKGGQSAERTFRCFGNEPPQCSDRYHTLGVNPAHSRYSGIEIPSNRSCGFK